MADAALMSEGALTSARKVRSEVLAGSERRLRWSVEEKLRTLAQCAAPSAAPALVCSEHGIGTGQLYTWRKQFRSGELTGFALVTVTPALDQLPEPNIPAEAASSILAPAASGTIEVELPSGMKLRLTGDIAEPLRLTHHFRLHCVLSVAICMDSDRTLLFDAKVSDGNCAVELSLRTNFVCKERRFVNTAGATEA